MKIEKDSILKLKPNRNIQFFLVILFIYGMLLTSRLYQCFQNEVLLENDVGQQCAVVGEIIVQKEKSYGYEYYLKADNIKINSSNIKKTNLKFQFFSPNNIKLNTKVKVIGQLSLFHLPKNPGDWNQRAYYKGKNIYYQLKKVHIKEIKPAADNYMIQFRTWVYYQSKKFLPETERALFLSLFVGDKSQLEQDLIEKFRRLGISHVLAVSGLHVGFLVWGISQIMKKLPLAYGIQYCLLLILLILYLLFTGKQPSTLRAVIMFIVLESSYFFEKPKDEKRAFWLTLAVVLLINPYSIYDIGFILSFATVAALLYIYPFLFSKSGKFIKAIGITLTAQITLLPLFSLYFHHVSMVAVLTNLIMIPIISFFLGSSILGLIFSAISTTLAQLIVGSSYFLIKYGLLVSEVIERLSWAELPIRAMTGWEIIIFYLIIIIGLITKNKKYLWGLGFSVIIFIPYQFQPQISMLDVGQAESMVIEYKNYCVVLDTGLAGNRSTVNYLAHQGQDKVDMVLLSHLDRDHAAGLKRILETYSVDFIGISANYQLLTEKNKNLRHTEKQYKELLALARKYNVKIVYIKAGDEIAMADLKLDILYPTMKDMPNMANDFSFVAQLQYGETDMLFTGDISGNVEKKLWKRGMLRDIEVLKVAHHGSKYSSQSFFLKITKPELAIISCGRYNKYGHPSSKLINYLKNRNVVVRVTAWDGFISIRFSKKGEVILNE